MFLIYLEDLLRKSVDFALLINIIIERSEIYCIIQILWSYLPVVRASHAASSEFDAVILYQEIDIFAYHGGGRALPPTPALTHNGTLFDPYKRSLERWVCIFFTVTQSFQPKLAVTFDAQVLPVN